MYMKEAYLMTFLHIFALVGIDSTSYISTFIISQEMLPEKCGSNRNYFRVNMEVWFSWGFSKFLKTKWKGATEKEHMIKGQHLLVSPLTSVTPDNYL